jgi:beta-N-acetylhexosaminidase
MTSSPSGLFGVGLAGPALDPIERAILERLPPRAVILFSRNIETERQLADLCDEIRSLPGEPLLCLDQEGGRVDRLRAIAGPFPSFYEAARAGLSRRAGEAAGDACARFGFRVDLAPVVDRRVPGAGEAVLGDRAAAEDPDRVAEAAREFLEGLHSRGVGGCLKHFPGLGRARFDTHLTLPMLPADAGGEDRDLAPFRALHELAGAVMVSHAASPDNSRPASLSPDVATRLLRDAVGFRGATFSDDLEMGALAEFGGLPERSAAAMRAGCDLLFVCSRLEEYPECVARVETEVPEDRRAEAARRMDGYADRLRGLSAAAPPPRSLDAIAADVAALKQAAGTGPTALHPPPY